MPLPEDIQDVLLTAAQNILGRLPSDQAICLECGTRFVLADGRSCACEAAEIVVGRARPTIQAA